MLPGRSYGSQQGIYPLRCVVYKPECFAVVAPCRPHMKCFQRECLPLSPDQIYYFYFFVSPSFFCRLFPRYDVSRGEWMRCNVHVQKTCRYPVFGLKEGSLYQFRVCAVNKVGVGRPSKATDPIRTVDPLKHTRTAGKW